MTDKVRGALFNVLGGEIANTRALDLFAGTGAVGIEALSRGAARVDFVDVSKKCVDLVKQNLSITGFSVRAQVKKMRAEDFLSTVAGQTESKYDLIFFCPPYADFSFSFLNRMAEILIPGGIVVAEMATRDMLAEENLQNFDIWQMKEYGDTRLMFLE